MKHLVIIGARGFGREIFFTLHLSESYKQGEYDVKGFLDDKADALDGFPCPYGDMYPPILGPVETYVPAPDDVFFCALGDPKFRQKYAEMILAKGGEFISIIHALAQVSPAARVGKGVYIGPWSSISTNVEVGDFTTIHPQNILGHDVKIGRYCAIETNCFFGGFSQMDDFAVMHAKSCIIPHKHIGKGTIVGIGSVVMRNFGDNLHLFGNPARKMEF